LRKLELKPSKSRSISIVKGKVVDKTFFINGEPIPTVSEKPKSWEMVQWGSKGHSSGGRSYDKQWKG